MNVFLIGLYNSFAIHLRILFDLRLVRIKGVPTGLEKKKNDGRVGKGVADPAPKEEINYRSCRRESEGGEEEEGEG